MKVLLDEMIDVRFRHLLPGHDVFTVDYMRWKSVKNGALVAIAAANRFEAMVTVDPGFAHEQNVITLPLAVIIIFADGTDVESLEPFAPDVLDKLKIAEPGMILEVRS